jgi:hypothetical protein
VVQFDFLLPKKAYFWLVLTANDVTLCLTDPGYEIDVFVTADLAAFYGIWWGRISFSEAARDRAVMIEGEKDLLRQFPGWFRWSAAQHMIGLRAAREQRQLGGVLAAPA